MKRLGRHFEEHIRRVHTFCQVDTSNLLHGWTRITRRSTVITYRSRHRLRVNASGRLLFAAAALPVEDFVYLRPIFCMRIDDTMGGEEVPGKPLFGNDETAHAIVAIGAHYLSSFKIGFMSQRG